MKEVEFLQFIVENIVDNPQDIIIDIRDDELGTLLTLQVNPKDMGLIIGKKGSTISSLRSLVRLQGMKIGKKLTLKIVEESHN
ncbi:KH domain-containing protein [Candidatus Gracilibacteria bacterium]|nr:KH domain-containing protein [Candidatus Gracilibacteria bacterium]